MLILDLVTFKRAKGKAFFSVVVFVFVLTKGDFFIFAAMCADGRKNQTKKPQDIE